MAISVRQRIGRDLPVGRKLGLSFGGFAVVALVLVGTMFLAIDDLSYASMDADDATHRHEASLTLQLASANLRAEQLSYLAANGAGREAYEAATRDFESALDALRTEGQSDVDRALINKIATGYRTFLSLDQFMWTAVQEGNADLAHELALGPAALNFGFMAADADLYAQAALLAQAEAEESFAAARAATLLRGAAIGFIAVVLVAAASRYLTRLIRDPLADLTHAAELAAAGDMKISAPVHGEDETGKLAMSFNTMLTELRRRETDLIEQNAKQALTRQFETALERAETEEDAHRTIQRTLQIKVPDQPTELLLADNSRAHFQQVLVSGPEPDGPGCTVPSPYACPAVRAAKPLTFESSNEIDACPHLLDRPGGPCAALCVPVSFMGRSVGVLHATFQDGTTPSEARVEGLTTMADVAGARIGVIRSTTKTQLQASTDSLTGLPNRRSFETRARALHRQGEQFTLVMADLDHFKLLNDTYGHEIGDRALRTFSEVLQSCVRDSDVVARWGGEEFTIALVGTPASAAAGMLDRFKAQLAEQLRATGATAFTASYGYVDASECRTFESAIRLADKALYESKAQGRDRATKAETADGQAELEAAVHVGAPVEDHFDEA